MFIETLYTMVCSRKIEEDNLLHSLGIYLHILWFYIKHVLRKPTSYSTLFLLAFQMARITLLFSLSVNTMQKRKYAKHAKQFSVAYHSKGCKEFLRKFTHIQESFDKMKCLYM